MAFLNKKNLTLFILALTAFRCAPEHDDLSKRGTSAGSQNSNSQHTTTENQQPIVPSVDPKDGNLKKIETESNDSSGEGDLFLVESDSVDTPVPISLQIPPAKEDSAPAYASVTFNGEQFIIPVGPGSETEPGDGVKGKYKIQLPPGSQVKFHNANKATGLNLTAGAPPLTCHDFTTLPVPIILTRPLPNPLPNPQPMQLGTVPASGTIPNGAPNVHDVLSTGTLAAIRVKNQSNSPKMFECAKFQGNVLGYVDAATRQRWFLAKILFQTPAQGPEQNALRITSTQITELTALPIPNQTALVRIIGLEKPLNQQTNNGVFHYLRVPVNPAVPPPSNPSGPNVPPPSNPSGPNVPPPSNPNPVAPPSNPSAPTNGGNPAPASPAAAANFIGTWFFQANKSAPKVEVSGSGLRFTNENGDWADGTWESSTSLFIQKWGVKVTISGSALRFSNGTVWQKTPNIDGRWSFLNGLTCYVKQDGKILKFTNENGQEVDGLWQGPTTILIPAWGKLTVTISGSTLNFSNRTTWTKVGP